MMTNDEKALKLLEQFKVKKAAQKAEKIPDFFGYRGAARYLGIQAKLFNRLVKAMGIEHEFPAVKDVGRDHLVSRFSRKQLDKMKAMIEQSEEGVK